MKPRPNAKSHLHRRQFLQGAGAAAGAVLAETFAPAWRQTNVAWAQDKKVIHFGASLPLSGPYEKVAKIYKDGYDFWTETVGGKIRVGGREMEVKWTIYDDQNNSGRVAQLTEKLITEDKVDLIVGTYGTDTVLAQGAVARKYGRVTIQGGAASARVDQEIGGHTTFTLVGLGSVYPKLMMEFAAKLVPKPVNIAVITMDDPVYQEMSKAVQEYAPKYGMKVILNEVLPMNVPDLRPTVLKLKRAGNVDFVYNTGWDLILIKLIEESVALDFNAKAICGGHLTTNPVVKETLKKRLDYVFGVTFWLPEMKFKDPHFKDSLAFAQQFQLRKGYAPTYHAPLSYSVPLLYELILRDAKEPNPLDPKILREKLLRFEQETVWGLIKFNEQGRIVSKELPVIQWQGAGPALEVVYPESMATAPVKYPAPPWSARS